MRKLVFTVLGVLALTVTAAAGLTFGAENVSAKAEVFHVTSIHAVVPGGDVDRCDGHQVSLTLFFNGPLHITDTPSGNHHFHVVNAGRFEAVSLDPAFEDESGRFTVHVTENSNSAGNDFVFTFSVKGEATDGQPLSWNQVAKIFVGADGEPQVIFDRIVNCS